MMEPPYKQLKLNKPQPCSSSSENSMLDEINEKDLPLLANVKDVLVKHYLMKMKTNFSQRVISGTSILYLDWLQQTEGLQSPSKIVLDACFLKVTDIFALKSGTDFKVPETFNKFDEFGCRKNYFKDAEESWLNGTDQTVTIGQKLNFNMNKWSVTISGWKGDPPSVIRIDYETLPNSPSLDWRPCNGFQYNPEETQNVCVYTPASPVNNRGLFPCQEAPSAMATWEILIEVEKGKIPLLTSDEHGELLQEGESTVTFYFYTSIPMPMSTFAFVIGHFTLQKELRAPDHLKNIDYHLRDLPNDHGKCEGHTLYPCRYSSIKAKQQRLIPARLFSLDNQCVLSINLEKLEEFVYSSLNNYYKVLGTHPFSRLDFVIMPFCYPHMGLASPGMVFLSPSNFTGSGVDDDNHEPLFICRILHEISHSWFGLSIGALDWTEEWLSEGFATFCEDLVFNEAFETYYPHKSKKFIVNERVLKICMRFMILEDEGKNAGNGGEGNNERQVLRGSGTGDNDQMAKNGLDPMKQFMHTHYYKGYLLLWHLAFLVGEENFVSFLKKYVHEYHGRLVSSDIFLQFYYDKFKNELSENKKFDSMDKLKTDWLCSDKLPEPFQSLNLVENLSNMNFEDAPLFSKANECLQNVKETFYRLDEGTYNYKRLANLSQTEVLILLEMLVRQMGKDVDDGEDLYTELVHSPVFKVNKQNPEIIHRWCELIILNKDKGRLNIVESFLQRHMAMGVYLYGELMISEDHKLQKVARRVHANLKNLYDLGSKRLLKEMLF